MAKPGGRGALLPRKPVLPDITFQWAEYLCFGRGHHVVSPHHLLLLPMQSR
jgi:hypothetical protein